MSPRCSNSPGPIVMPWPVVTSAFMLSCTRAYILASMRACIQAYMRAIMRVSMPA